MQNNDSQISSQQDTDVTDRNADSLVVEAMAEYRKRLDAGEAPDRNSFLSRYSSIAEELAACLDSLEFVRTVAPQFSVQDEAANQEGDSVRLSSIPLGDYQIRRELGRGGMGVVYEANQLSMDRTVALKVLPFAALLDERQLQRFKNEARAAGTLHHPNIVPVYGVGTDRGVHYYSMQYIDGISLAQLLLNLRDDNSSLESIEPSTSENDVGASSALSDTQQVLQAALSTQRDTARHEYFRTVAQWGRQVAGALAYAHDHGILHRDIKPGNLLMDNQGNLWVTDFGLARLETDASLTMTGDLIGTLRYMAPEQTLGNHALVDHRADVYSLAATLYELLALRPAYESNNRQELLNQIARDEPTRLRRIDPRIPAELETIVAKGMSRDAFDRYASAEELENDLRRFLDDRPIQAKTPTIHQRIAKWTRRNPIMVWATIVTLLLVTVSFGISTLLVMQKQQAVEKERNEAIKLSKTLDVNLYGSEMNLAYQAWDRGNVDVVHQLLSQQIPDKDQTDHRGVEWYYLASLCKANRGGKPITEFDQRTKWVLSSDEREVATIINDDLVTIDLTSLKTTVLKEDVKQSDDYCRLAFSRDHHRLAFCTREGTQVLDRRTVEKAFSIPGFKPTFSPDGKWGANVVQKSLQLWDARTGKIKWKTPLRIQYARPICIIFSPDSSKVVATDSIFNKLFVVDVVDGTVQMPDKVVVHHPTDALFVSNKDVVLFGRNGIQVFDISRDITKARLNTNIVEVLAPINPEPSSTIEPRPIFLPNVKFVSAAAISKSGDRMALGKINNRVEVWDLTTGKRIWRQSRKEKVTQVQFLSNERQLLLSYGNRVELCEIDHKNQTTFAQDARSNWKDSFDICGEKVAIPGPSHQLTIWRPDQNTSFGISFERRMETVEASEEIGNQIPSSVAFSPNGEMIAVGTSYSSDRLRFFSTVDGVPLDEFDLNYGVRSIAFHPNGNRVAIGTRGFAILDLKTGNIEEFQTDYDWADVRFSNSGHYLFVHGRTKNGEKMSVWNVESEHPIHIKEVEINNKRAHGIVAVSPDDRQLFIADGFGAITTIAIPQFEIQSKFVAHTLEVTSIAFSPDGRTIVTAGADGLTRFWQRDSWKQVGEFYTDDTCEFVRFISSSTKGLGLVVARRSSPNLPVDLRVHWIDMSDDWEWLVDHNTEL